MSEIEIVGGLLDHYVQLPNDIFRTPGIKSRAVHVYGNLRSNRTGWQTNTRQVSEVTGLSHNTVMSAINDLIELGYVERTEIPGEGGQFSSYRYRVFDSRNQIVGTVPDAKIESGNLTEKLSQAPDAKIESYKKNSFKKTKEEDYPPIVPQGDARDVTPVFDEWYEHYPKKVGRGQAVKAFKTAIKKTDLETMVAATLVYAKSVEGKEKQFVKNPSTWLNGECWLDDVDVPDSFDDMGGDDEFRL